MSKQAFDKMAAGLTEALEIARGEEGLNGRLAKLSAQALHIIANLLLEIRAEKHMSDADKTELISKLSFAVAKLRELKL